MKKLNILLVIFTFDNVEIIRLNKNKLLKFKKKNKMTMTMYLSTINWNINGLNAPNKIHGVAEWIRKQNTYAVHKRLTSDQKTHKDWK